MGGLRRGLPALVALFLASAVPAPALAASKGEGCAVMKALANADGRRFADLRLSVGPRPGLSIMVGRVGSDLPEPHSCDLDYGESDIDLSCQWQFADYAAALAFFDPLVERAKRCLEADLPQTENGAQTTAWRTLRRHESDLHAGEGETHFELSLVEYARPADAYLPAETGWYVVVQTEWSLD
jgi:hypothetical protein